MIKDVQVLTTGYWNWLNQETEFRIVENFVEITTPYLDRHNDYLRIYITREDGIFLLSDHGYVIEDLELSGCNLDEPRQQDILQEILHGVSVQLNCRALEIITSPDDFSVCKHNLVQAMLAVNGLYWLSQQ